MYRKAESCIGSGSIPYFYCNLICELLHVLIINPKSLEVHPLGSTPGHTTIFELALLIGPILLLVRVSIYA